MRNFALFALPALVAAASGCATATPSAPGNGLFEAYEITTAPAAHQTVLVGSFVDDHGAQLIEIGVDASAERRLRLYAFDGSEWTRTHETSLPADALYVAVARIAGRDRLVMFRDGGLYWLDPVAATEHPIAKLTTSFSAPDDAGVPELDVVRDLNGDGRDDFLVPDLDGFWVVLQSADGSFAAPLKLGPEEPFLDAKAYGDQRTYREVGVTPQNLPWYLNRVHQLDFDHDGRDDLVFWNTDHFLVYRQGPSGTFPTSPDTFTTDVAFDFDGAYGLAFQFGDASVPALLLGFTGRVEHRILHGVRDLNGDGFADLVVLSLAGRSPLRLRGRYEVHFGQPAADGTVFAADVDTMVDAPGKSGGLQPWGYAAQYFLDFDGDGAMDTAMAAVNTSLGGMFRAMVGNSISMELHLYRFQDGRYPDHPDATRRVGSPFAPLDRRGPLFPTVLVGDVNGDRRSDLLVGDRWDQLSVFLGQPGTEPYASEAHQVPVAIPADERNARLVDLDLDAKQDVIIQHPSATEPGRMTILMAR